MFIVNGELSNFIVSIVFLILLSFFFSKRIRDHRLWRATVTPLASIIGSGFLIAGPLLFMTVGRWAILAMVGIVLMSFLLGSVIRFNIRTLEPRINHSGNDVYKKLEFFSRVALGFAYIISVTYYLKLFSAFILSEVSHQMWHENLITTLILILIGAIGLRGGLPRLERFEEYAVNIKLSIILTVLAAALWYNIRLISASDWMIADGHRHLDFGVFQMILSFLIIIQGFETSRFLGNEYKPMMRQTSMMLAQIIAGFVYICFMALTIVIYPHIPVINETSIIATSTIIVPILGVYLFVAALCSQFSAAIADTLGSGGLLSEAFKGKFSLNINYVIIMFLSLALTWLTDIYGIIAYASKGFAVYYAFEAFIAMMLIYQLKKEKIRFLAYFFGFLMMLSVILLGVPLEGH